jgi:hypothetical protein
LLIDLISAIIFLFAPFLPGLLSTVRVTAARLVTGPNSNVASALCEGARSLDFEGLTGHVQGARRVEGIFVKRGMHTDCAQEEEGSFKKWVHFFEFKY